MKFVFFFLKKILKAKQICILYTYKPQKGKMKRKEINKRRTYIAKQKKKKKKKKIHGEKFESENWRRGIGTELLIEDEEK